MFIGIFDRPQRASPATPVARAPVPVCTVSLLVVCFTASSDAVRRVSLDGRGDAATVQLAVRCGIHSTGARLAAGEMVVVSADFSGPLQ